MMRKYGGIVCVKVGIMEYFGLKNLREPLYCSFEIFSNLSLMSISIIRVFNHMPLKCQQIITYKRKNQRLFGASGFNLIRKSFKTS